MNIAGVLLAGGRSSRYGRPKMFEPFEGIPLYQHSLNALKQNNLSTVIVATNDELRPFFQEDSEITWALESTKHQGPLFALYQLLVENPSVDWFFLVAADMPYMNAAFIENLVAQIEPHLDAIIPIQNERMQPLAGLYNRSTLEKTAELVANNRRSMKALLDSVCVHYSSFSNEDPTFTNINYQTDWPKGDS